MLTTKLRVIASKERSRQELRETFATRLREIRGRVKLAFDNALRPIAFPATGGLLASFLCFGILVDTLHIDGRWKNDIPVGLFTQVILDEPSPFCVTGKDVLVQLTVDAEGNVSDFMVPQGQSTPAELQEIGNLVMYSSFTPATSFGQRVTGKILVNIHHIQIRG